MKYPLPPGIRTDRKTPRVTAAIVTVVAFVFCLWGTWELSRRVPAEPTPGAHPPRRSPEEYSETTLVKRMLERNSSPIIFSQANAGR